MKNHKMYEADDRMISLIRDNYSLLQSLGSFGINLGFGDKTVSEVCQEQGVDTYTYLAVVNFTINGYRELSDFSKLSIPTLLQYLKAMWMILAAILHRSSICSIRRKSRSAAVSAAQEVFFWIRSGKTSTVNASLKPVRRSLLLRQGTTQASSAPV